MVITTYAKRRGITNMKQQSLEEFRLTKGWTYEKLGEKLGCPAQTAYRYCKFQRMPRRAAMARIKKITGGQVTAASFYQQPAKQAA